jgi:hypothetical protein
MASDLIAFRGRGMKAVTSVIGMLLGANSGQESNRNPIVK